MVDLELLKSNWEFEVQRVRKNVLPRYRTSPLTAFTVSIIENAITRGSNALHVHDDVTVNRCIRTLQSWR